MHNHANTEIVRKLRNNLTEAEKRLWHYLREYRKQGLKFRRQHPIGKYIVDFVCLDKKVVVELDGGQHYNSATDDERDRWLRNEGFTAVRFWNNEVIENVGGVIYKILTQCGHPHPVLNTGQALVFLLKGEEPEQKPFN